MISRLQRILVGLFLSLSISTGCTTDHSTDAAIEDGLYLLTDSLSGITVKEDIRFNEKGYTFIAQPAILSLKEAKVDFTYDRIIYADTFAVVHFTGQSLNKGWKDQLKNTANRKVGLIVDQKLVQWEEADHLVRSSEMIMCYCDNSKEAIKEIEESIKKRR